ncbi:MAG TPA: CocE/NonD family hydrolase [Mucilaginibacter sp.]
MKKTMLVLALVSWCVTLFAQKLPQTTAEKYIINDSVLIKTPQGHTLSAVTVRRRDIAGKQPAALLMFIYSNTQRSLAEAQYAADHGYVGVVADVRGKRLSPDEVAPYENDAHDVYWVIDWINKQSWSNGKVGMYGGSYSGFAQWAGLKYKVHPALKTIVPYVSAIPGMGLPMENNVFLNANYGWAFYVTNNKYLDTATYNNNQRWQDLMTNWYSAGAAYNKIDSVDHAPNKWLQKWLKHPGFDAYWQSLIPYGHEYAKIDIPVLAFDGYYDDGQTSGLYYLRQLAKYNPKADYYLILGPYDHFGAQKGGEANLRGYQVDPSALINTKEITFQWFDYIMKNGKKPAILKDRVNYEVMGANRWDGAPSIDKMHQSTLRLYLHTVKKDDQFKLSAQKPAAQGYLEQEVDFADRTTMNNFAYPYPIVQKDFYSNGFSFMSEPLTQPLVVNGAFWGRLTASVNKKDLDYSVVLYEVMPTGEYFELTYFLGRASYSWDINHRRLLHPGKITNLPFSNTKIVSRQLSKGSRLMVVVNVNKSRFAQINYGTGKDVSTETIADAKTPLRVKWYNNSYIEVPVSK